MPAFPLPGDDITAQSIGEFVLDGLLSDKITSGLGVTSNTSTNEITVDAGTAGVSHSDRLYRVDLASQTTEAFATTSGTNFVYLAFNDSTGAESIEVVDTQGAVGDPALLIAEVDGSTGDVTPRNDTDLGDATGGDVVFDSVSTDNISVDGDDSNRHWTTDGIWTPSGSSDTFTVNGSYEVLQIWFGVLSRFNTDTSASPLELRIDGVSSSDYQVIKSDGSALTDATEWQLSEKIEADGGPNITGHITLVNQTGNENPAIFGDLIYSGRQINHSLDRGYLGVKAQIDDSLELRVPNDSFQGGQELLVQGWSP